jgi:hypothetical protein
MDCRHQNTFTFIALIMLIVTLPLSTFGRVFLVGSNPSLTILAFPQDLLKFQKEFVFFYASYEGKPWWGDVDDPPNKPINESANRPNNSYLATGADVVDGDGTTFKHKSGINALNHLLGFDHTFNNGIKSRFDIRYSGWLMHAKAEGSSGATSFEYKERNSFHEIYQTSIFAGMFRDYPIGIKLGLGLVNTTKPTNELTISTNGVTNSSNRLYWGWSAIEGGTVPGTSNHLAHAVTQDEYSKGPLYEFDIQAGITLPKLTLGTRFRDHFGKLTSYEWNDTTKAYKHSGASKIKNITGRLYFNKIWSEGDKYRFGTLVLSRYTFYDTTFVSIDNNDIENGEKKGLRNFVFQVNPNISLYPWRTKQTYIDAAILVNYSYMHYKYTDLRGISGGQKRTFQNTRYYSIDEYWWQPCSYFYQNFFEVALDLNPVFPVYGNKDKSVAIGAMLLLWTRFKWTNKYYGNSVVSGSDFDFDITNIRKNYDHETWLNSFFNIIYRNKGYIWRLDVGQPLIYNLTPKTRITDKTGKTTLFVKASEGMWIAQSGVKIGFFVTTDINNFKSLFNKGTNTF